MERRALLSALAVGVSGLAGCTGAIPDADGSGPKGQSELPEEYPDGAGPDGIDFSTLESDDETPLHAPRDHWDSYAIVFDEPPDRHRVEGDYYVNSSTGELISELYYGATDYRNGDTYAYVHPADELPAHQPRDEWESDPQFTYHSATDAYYRYDPHYGQIAPTNIGRHTDMAEPYGWEAVGTATHHGVPVVTYRLSDAAPDDSRATPAVEGSLDLGVEDGVVYAFDLTLDAEGEPRYSYAVRPAPFPDHKWVETARAVSGSTDGANESA